MRLFYLRNEVSTATGDGIFQKKKIKGSDKNFQNRTSLPLFHYKKLNSFFGDPGLAAVELPEELVVEYSVEVLELEIDRVT